MPCTPDPQGRALNGACEIDPCVPFDGSAASTGYVGGHVGGGRHGTTAGHIYDCTIPLATLPVTGNTEALWKLAAGACAAGLILMLVSAARRR